MRYIIILGGSIEQEKIYLLCRQYKLKIISVDRLVKPYCFKYSDIHLNVSIKDSKKIYKQITKLLIKNIKIIGVVSIASDVPYSVSFLSKKLRLKSIDLKSSLIASNKIKMKKKFIQHGILTPKFYHFKKFKKLEKFFKNQNINFVIKPSDNSGARGVFLVEKSDLNKKKKIKNFFKKSTILSKEKRIIVEEFLNGPQVSAEGIFIKKKYYNVALADRNYSNLEKTKPYIIEDGGSTPSYMTNKKFNLKIQRVIRKACNALKINWGVVKADIVIHNKKIYLIELAARVSGGYFATHSIPIVYKVDLVEMLLREVLNLKNKPPKLKIYNYVAQRYFFSPPGKIKRIEGVSALKKTSYVKKFEIYIRKNLFQKKITSHPDRSGMVICSSKNYKNAIKRADSSINKVKFIIW